MPSIGLPIRGKHLNQTYQSTWEGTKVPFSRYFFYGLGRTLPKRYGWSRDALSERFVPGKRSNPRAQRKTPFFHHRCHYGSCGHCSAPSREGTTALCSFASIGNGWTGPSAGQCAQCRFRCRKTIGFVQWWGRSSRWPSRIKLVWILETAQKKAYCAIPDFFFPNGPHAAIPPCKQCSPGGRVRWSVRYWWFPVCSYYRIFLQTTHYATSLRIQLIHASFELMG